MDFSYVWPSTFRDQEKDAVQEQMDAAVKDQDIEPCHSGTMSVNVTANASDFNFAARLFCSCGKKLVSVHGNTNA